MVSNLIRVAPHEAEAQLGLTLRQAFHLLEPNLRPPFPLTIPSSDEYLNLNRAILYGILTEPHCAQLHIKHLHAVVTDGYAFFVNLVVEVVNGLFQKLIDSVRKQVIWVTREMVNVCAEGFDGLLVSLLRQIVGGDFSKGNLWLCFEVVSLFLDKWTDLLEEEPTVLTYGLYGFLRLLADHCRFLGDPNLEPVVNLEIKFCTRMLREQFRLCLKIGRDLIRLLQDLVHVPEFRALWKDLLLNPHDFGTSGFSDISQLYCTRTLSQYFLLRITPEMEEHLRFLLTHVKLGSQKRHQAWFASKYLCTPERETLICDIVRFICCAHHPHKEVIQSDIVPRWAVIGWLLKSCRKNYIQSNAKLALFYDWIFFDEKIDKLLNIEPAMQLMVFSIPKYMEITNSLLDFLFLLVDNYDVERKEIIIGGVSSSLNTLFSKAAIQKIDILTSSEGLSAHLRERLGSFLGVRKGGISRELNPSKIPAHSLPALSLPKFPLSGTPTSSPEQPTGVHKIKIGPEFVDWSVTSCTPAIIRTSNQTDVLENLVQNLTNSIKQSNSGGLCTLQEILDMYVNVEELPVSGPISVQALCLKITQEFEHNGNKLFETLEGILDESGPDIGVESATNIIMRKFFFTQNKRMQELLLFWSKDLFPVGSCLLLYASTLANEANMCDNLNKLMEKEAPLLCFHIKGRLSLSKSENQNSPEAIDSASNNVDRELVGRLLEDAFKAYRNFLLYSRSTLHREADTSLSKLLLSDLMTCLKWKGTRLKFLLDAIFCHLPDLSVGNAGIVRLLVDSLEDVDFVTTQFDIGLKKFSVFGEGTEAIFGLIKSSLNWQHVEQHKLWNLLKLELSVTQVPLEKLILNFFCSEVDPSSCSIAVGGLLMLCSSCAPTPEVVGAVLFLPNNSIFQGFSAAVLGIWSVSNAAMLFDSLAKFAEKYEKQSGESIFSESANFAVNNSAIMWLLNYFDATGMNISNILGSHTSNTTGGKAVT